MDLSGGEAGDLGDGEVTSPRVKRARASPKVKNATPGVVASNDQAHLMTIPEFSPPASSPGVQHLVPQQYGTHIQPPTAPMNYAPQPHQDTPPALLPVLPRKLLPPRHDTAGSLTGYLSYITAKSSASFAPSLINTSFTLPWSFGVPRDYITVPPTPGSKSSPIRHLLYRLNIRIVHEMETAANGEDGDGNQKEKEMEALVSMARKSMDVQNCLTEVATSLVKLVQSVDGFVYVMCAANRVPQAPGDQAGGVGHGMLGGNWDFTFVCNCSEEARALPEQSRLASTGDNTDAQAGKHYACQGRIVVGFLEQEETVVLKYRHCAVHRRLGAVTHRQQPAVERTIVGGVVSRKAPNPPPQSQIQAQSPLANGATAYSTNFYPTHPQQQGNGYILVNGQWYYPPATPGGHYTQPSQQASPQRGVAHQPYQHAVVQSDPLPGDSMAQIYNAAMVQYTSHTPPRRKGRNSISDSGHGEPSTEQRLLVELRRELGPLPHTPQQVEVKDELGAGSGQEHHQTESQEYDYSGGYAYSGTTSYAHGAVAPLAGGAELGNGSGGADRGAGEGGAHGDGDGDMSMGGHGHGGQEIHEDVEEVEVDSDAGVKELVQQLVQQANSSMNIGTKSASASLPPAGSESPETKRKSRRRGRSAKG